MRSIIILHILLSISLVCKSQSDFKSGYVITLDNDTLYGFIDYRGSDFNARKCVFKSAMDSLKAEYSPREIKSYRLLDDKLYVSREVITDSLPRIVFLEQLVDGRADLYFLPPKIFFIETEERGMHRLENTETIVEAKDGTAVFLQDQLIEDTKKYFKEGNEYLGILKIYLQDQFQLMDDIDRVEFDQADLIDITTKYHELACPDEECIVYVKSDVHIRNRIILSAGCNTNMLKIYHLNAYNADIFQSHTSLGYMAGLELETYRTGSYERIFSRVSVFYTQVEHEDNTDYLLHLKYQTLNIGFSMNYIYPRYKLKPYIGLGLMYLISFENEGCYIRSTYINYNPRRESVGPVANFGLYYKSESRMGFKLQAEYMYDAFRLTFDPSYYTEANNLNISIGLVMDLVRK